MYVVYVCVHVRVSVCVCPYPLRLKFLKSCLVCGLGGFSSSEFKSVALLSHDGDRRADSSSPSSFCSPGTRLGFRFMGKDQAPGLQKGVFASLLEAAE